MIISYDLAAPKAPQKYFGKVLEKFVDKNALKSLFRGFSKSDHLWIFKIEKWPDPRSPLSKLIPDINIYLMENNSIIIHYIEFEAIYLIDYFDLHNSDYFDTIEYSQSAKKRITIELYHSLHSWL